MGVHGMKLTYSKDRVAEAREIRTKWYRGEKVERNPFQFIVRADVWRVGNANPYSFREVNEDPWKAVHGQMLSMQHCFDTFPDCDYLPVFTLDHLGEGVLPSMYGARQMVVDDNQPFTEGRVMRDIYDIEKLPKKVDVENSEWGKILKEQILCFLDATHGEIPVSVADHQSPYGIATKLLPNEELMYAMYDEPALVHQLMDIVTNGIIDLIETMKGWVGEDLLVTNTYNPIPKTSGLILYDDYVSVLSPALHKAFCAPYNIRLFEKYGYGHLHTCGPYFPGYLDACIACKPRSLDVSIMRDTNKTRADLLAFRRITAEHNILLLSGPGYNDLKIFDQSIFDNVYENADFDLYLEYARYGHYMSALGTYEEGLAFRRLVDRVSECIR